jgi:hypothetical protein
MAWDEQESLGCLPLQLIKKGAHPSGKFSVNLSAYWWFCDYAIMIHNENDSRISFPLYGHQGKTLD